MRYKAVIFDLDGTLLDTLEDIADATNSVLSRFGFPQHDLQTYKYFVGEGIRSLIQRALPPKKFEEEFITHCVTLMRVEYGKSWTRKTRLYQEVTDILDFFTNQEIKMAILSNKPDDFTKKMAAIFLRRWPFSIVQGEQPFVPKKPDPTAALSIAESLKLPPKAFLFLGDSEVDMKTALAAGMYPVGVLWGFRTAKELIASGAKILIKNSADLIDAITY